MGVTINEKTEHLRDGRLCVAKFVITGESSTAVNGVTTVDVVGQIVQINVVSSGNADTAWTLELEDSTNAMTIYASGNGNHARITANNVNAGSGSYCRGKLKCGTGTATTLVAGAIKTVFVYYIKM
tara:strand:+ start:2986 stop:3363 length:378 start_codon:yes stop_codon:yes gene_type:complete